MRVSIVDRAERTRLVLQIERDLVTEARLRTLLTAAQTTLATHRRGDEDLPLFKASQKQ